MKFIKIILGIIAILFIGYLYNQWDLSSESTSYTFLESNFENGLNSITIREVPTSICKDKLKSTVESAKSGNSNMEVVQNKCLDELPAEYIGIFQNNKLGFPYVSLDFKYRERHIITNLPKGLFGNVCDNMKSRHSIAVCVE